MEEGALVMTQGEPFRLCPYLRLGQHESRTQVTTTNIAGTRLHTPVQETHLS